VEIVVTGGEQCRNVDLCVRARLFTLTKEGQPCRTRRKISAALQVAEKTSLPLEAGASAPA
jgi:hypothetical protein